MNRISIALIAAWILSLSVSSRAETSDLGARDTLRLVASRPSDTELRVLVEVHNDEKLTGLDIPLRFGMPGDSIDLKRVEWSDRVDAWEMRTATIDSVNKTVIIGLISVLVTDRPNSELSAVSAQADPKVVELVFTVGSRVSPRFEAFTTDSPGHYLAFFYNRYDAGGPYVEEFTPEVKVDSGGE